MTDTHAATELEQYIENDAELHRQQHMPILKNLATKKARGQYKHALAVKLFGYLVESGAKKYAKAFGSSDQPWHKMFDVPTRKRVAEELTKSFEAEHKLGNYDNLLPKKYQKLEKTSALHHARKKKVSWKSPETYGEPHALGGSSRAHSTMSLHARKKSLSQLDREIANVVPSWRGGR